MKNETMNRLFREGGNECDDVRMLETAKGGKNVNFLLEVFGRLVLIVRLL